MISNTFSFFLLHYEYFKHVFSQHFLNHCYQTNIYRLMFFRLDNSKMKGKHCLCIEQIKIEKHAISNLVTSQILAQWRPV